MGPRSIPKRQNFKAAAAADTRYVYSLNESWLNISADMCFSHVLFQMYFLFIDPLIEIIVLLLLSVVNIMIFYANLGPPTL